MNKPICKECESKGEKYIVTEPTGGVTTLMGIIPGFWDEDGAYHPPHNPNYATYEYHCSKGHSWNSNS